MNDQVKKEVKKVDQIDPEMEMFYRALGQFNTNIVGWLLSEPESIGKITKFLDNLACPAMLIDAGTLGLISNGVN